MTFSRTAVRTLIVLAAAPLLHVESADAAFIRRSVVKTITNSSCCTSHRVVAVGEDSDTAHASTVAQVQSEAGDEDVTLVESDAWLHGAALIKALPSTDAKLSLTLYDKGSVAILSLSGTLGADGSVSLTAEPGKLDVDLLAAETFATKGGYDVSVDLAGADTYSVAYAKLTVTETPCEKGCTPLVTGAEVDWDTIGAVWEGDLTLDHTGLVEVKIVDYDTAGKKLAADKAKLGMPWEDDGYGAGTVASDEDPLTRLGIVPDFSCSRVTIRQVCPGRIVAVSEGWAVGDELPANLSLELAGGTATSIAANSYQRPARRKYLASIRTDSVNGSAGIPDHVDLVGTQTDLYGLTFAELETPACSGSTCVVLSPDAEGNLAISVTAYGPVAADLPDDEALTLTVYDADGAVIATEDVEVEFDDSYAVVFAAELSLSGDPLGTDLSGKVTLLGAPTKKGKQATLSKGSFYASIARDGDGDLSLVGADKDTVTSSGLVKPGAAVMLTDKEAAPLPPPAIQYGNGSGTRNASSQVSARPQLF